MDYKDSSRRSFLGKTSAAVLGVAVLSSQNVIASIFNSQAPFEGYNPYTDQCNDLRTQRFGTETLCIHGTLFCAASKAVIADAKIEVWHLSPQSKKYGHRGYFFTDSQGGYLFKTNFPNRKEGRAARIFFKISSDKGTEFTELLLDSNTAYINDKHWVKNKGLQEKLFPKYNKGLFETNIEFNFTL
jgi:protocatechuate 3,4-dioxygenase beta subunit